MHCDKSDKSGCELCVDLSAGRKEDESSARLLFCVGAVFSLVVVVVRCGGIMSKPVDVKQVVIVGERLNER
jgi:hypothetical protein